MNVLARRVFGAALGSAALLFGGEARAWYFPEHVLIARDAVHQLPSELRDVIARAVDGARAEGLPLCPRVDAGLDDLTKQKPFRTPMLRSEVAVDCIPYAALPAIAGDHANGVAELRAVLASKKGLELTTAAAFEWRRFREAIERMPRPVERMSFVHELDVDFYFIDPGYELRAQKTRSHFVDAGRSLAEVVRDAGAAGAVDNAIGQFLVHHLRSLELATSGSAPRRTEALLEHALAVHFLEDAFSAGHLVMTPRIWANGNASARQRHDFFDAKGIAVRRALSAEPCAALEEGAVEGGVPPCWMTTGDGYLGLTADASDRTQAARAVKKAELQLALALDPDRVVAIARDLGDREQLAIGALLDPMPWWTLEAGKRRRHPTTPARALAHVRGAAAAITRLRGAGMPAVEIGVRAPAPLFGPSVIACTLDPCTPRVPPIANANANASADDDDEDACGPDRVLALGTVGASLLRPLLVELPAADRDVGELEGRASTDHGLAFQLLASANAGAVFPDRTPIDVFAPSLGVAMGFAYRFGTYLPGRRNRSGVEVNVGISAGLHFDTRGHAGGNPEVTMLEQELRWPLLWEGLTSYVLPLDLGRSKNAGSIILLGGARVREMLSGPVPQFWGFEVETVAFALSSGSGAYPLYSVSPEIRFYVGGADPSVAQPSLPSSFAPTVGVTVTGGYATFL